MIRPRAGARGAAVALAAASMLGACVHIQTRAGCPAGETASTTAELYFGRNIGQSLGVSEDEFRRFLEEEATPRFPDGLTVQDAQGQWRDGQGLVREPSKVLLLILPGKPDDRARVRAIAEAYKTRFRQQAVLVVYDRACTSF